MSTGQAGTRERSSGAGTNWAGNYEYRASRFAEPTTVAELQDLVGSHQRVRALGSRHSFTDIADTRGLLVSTRRLPEEIEIDEAGRTVTVGGGVTYSRLAETLHSRGWALPNMASLPHISVAGAVATGTHGSGDRNRCLSASVSAIEVLGPDGAPYRRARGDADFDGSVVALGALGVVTRLTLDIEPAFEVRQDCWTDLPWSVVQDAFDAVMGHAYSVSLFTNWVGDTIDQVWLKSRGETTAGDFYGARASTRALHMIAGVATDAVTEQGGAPGPWHERLPHFRTAFTPSHGEELQSEYLVPRSRAPEAFVAMRRLGPQFAPVLQVGEIRTIASDTLWLSAAYGQDVVGLHFTWRRDPRAVSALLPAVEDALLPLGARPHWGKCFAVTRPGLEPLYPRFGDFLDLRRRTDPTGKFSNRFTDRVLGALGEPGSATARGA